MIYFVSGHREITQSEFDSNYGDAIRKAVSDPQAEFVVGDYWGVDIMAQNLLVDLGVADRVTVYHMFESPRNYNAAIAKTKGGYTTDEERDSAMTAASDIDIAFVRHGKWGSGTAQNIKRRHGLVSEAK